MDTIGKLAAAGLCALLLAACAQPVPPERSAYVGQWREARMRLAIFRDGRVEYARREGSTTTTIKAPLQRFEGDNFVVGVWRFNTTFVVSAAPHLEGNTWIMVVDGVRLTRTDGGG